MLKIEDLKVGDGLACLDVEAYLVIDNLWMSSRRKIIESSLIVDRIYDDGALGLEGTDYCIPVKEFEFFKKKEEPKHTFNDLIDVARKAVDDGVLKGYSVENKLVKSLSIKFSDNNISTWGFGEDDYSIQISHIQSLYKETFVIETVDAISQIQVGAKITLLNGKYSKVTSIHPLRDAICVDESDYALDIFVLKGATVEQEKS